MVLRSLAVHVGYMTVEGLDMLHYHTDDGSLNVVLILVLVLVLAVVLAGGFTIYANSGGGGTSTTNSSSNSAPPPAGTPHR
jgi:hypothetical protein